MRKLKTTLCLITATTAGLAFNPNSLSDPTPIRTAVHGVVRSSRAISTIALTAVDYKLTLRGLAVDSDEYRRKLSEVHLRSALRVLKMCEANKGFYVKAGQFVAALRQVPKEYSSTLTSLQDQAVPCHFKAIEEVLVRNLGNKLSDTFLSLDQQPLAAASIAQVHKAVLQGHQAVAIKVQYPGLEEQMKLDTTTMYFISKSITWFFFRVQIWMAGSRVRAGYLS